jgi:hypothetical protein
MSRHTPIDGPAGLVLGTILAVVGCAACAGCASPAVPRASLPSAPDQQGQGRCLVAASQGSPLVTEWPASEKANLEVRLREGGVAVTYSGCSMRILSQCQLGGHYQWQRTTPATDRIEIENVDELYSKLPLGAVNLEGELERSGRLAVRTTVAGQFQLLGVDPGQVGTTAGCAAATHVVRRISVGAFRLSSGGTLSGEASTSIAGVGKASVNTESEKSLVREAGLLDYCGDASDQAPHPDCNSPIQLHLDPLPGHGGRQVEGPPGTVRVDFYSGHGDSVWEVIADRKTLCKTPCSTWIDPGSALAMRERRPWAPDEQLNVPSLQRYSAAGQLQVRAHPTHRMGMASGMMVTSLAGAAAVTGIVLTSVGCSQDSSGAMCRGGLISLPIGLVGLVPGIWMILHYRAHAEVTPAGETHYVGLRRVRSGVVAGPGFFAGTF